MAVQATRQEIVRVLRKTGFTEVAESPSGAPATWRRPGRRRFPANLPR